MPLNIIFTYPTLLISYVYTVLYTILLHLGYAVLYHHSFIYLYVHILYTFTLVCIKGSSCGIVRLDYSLVITALSELEAQAFRYTRINIC